VLAFMSYALPLLIPWIAAAPSLIGSEEFVDRWRADHSFSLELVRRVVTGTGLFMPAASAFVWWGRGMRVHVELITALCPELSTCANARVAGAVFARAARRTGVAWVLLAWLAGGAAGMLLFLGSIVPRTRLETYQAALAMSLLFAAQLGILLLFRARIRRAIDLAKIGD